MEGRGRCNLPKQPPGDLAHTFGRGYPPPLDTRGGEKPALRLLPLKGQAVLVSEWSGGTPGLQAKSPGRSVRSLVAPAGAPLSTAPVGTLRILIQAQGQRLAEARLGVEGCEGERPMGAREAWLKGLQQGQKRSTLKGAATERFRCLETSQQEPGKKRTARVRRHGRKQPT